MLSPRLILGRTKAGKTYLMQALAAALSTQSPYRTLALDPNKEWPGRASRGRYALVRTPEGAARAFAAGHNYVVVRVEEGSAWWDSGEKSERPLFRAAVELVRVARRAATEARPCVVMLPESWMSLGVWPAKVGGLWHPIARHRHPGVRTVLWVDTQHWVDAHPRLRREAERVYWFATGDYTDRDEVKRRFGLDALAALDECGRRFEAGEKGWHLSTVPAAGTWELRPPIRLAA